MYLWHMLLMHSIISRTDMVRNSGITLPEKTFYVDNLFSYAQLPFVNKIYYSDTDLYHYYIGRSDQSVTIENMVSRYRQQILVTSSMMKLYSYEEISSLCKPLQKQMYHFLHSVLANTYFFTTQKDEYVRRKDLECMWHSLRSNDFKLYNKLRKMPLLIITGICPWKVNGFISLFAYKVLTKITRLGV